MPTTYDSNFHIDNIVEKYGKKLDADMVKAYCDANPIGYQTITKFLNKYKTKRGHWNVTVSQAKAKLEQTFNEPTFVKMCKNFRNRKMLTSFFEVDSILGRDARPRDSGASPRPSKPRRVEGAPGRKGLRNSVRNWLEVN